MPQPTTGPDPSAPEGLRRFCYLAADGGPHMLLPAELAASWSGVSPVLHPLDSRSDYGRACAATASTKMALIVVGSGTAMVFGGPPMTAWGKSADGLVEIYYLDAWTNTDLDSLIDRATAGLPTASLQDSGGRLRLTTPDAFLLFAGDTPTDSACGVHRVPLAPGEYRVLSGTYSGTGESVIVYRLQPVAP